MLFEDNHLLVVDKPAGLLTQAARAGDDTLVERARSWLVTRHGKPGSAFVGLVHRLDRSTSGVVVLAKTSKAAARLSDLIKKRTGFDKRYVALVSGRLTSDRRLEHLLVEVGDGSAIVPPGAAPPIGAKPAALDVIVLATSDAATLVEIVLETGRKHQIRVQLAAIGHALLGDRRYGGPAELVVGARSIPVARVMLHAWQTAITHPTLRETIAFEAPIPSDFQALCEALGIRPLPSGSKKPRAKNGSDPGESLS